MALQPDSELDAQAVRLDPNFRQRVERLHQLTVYGRWLVVGGLWLTIGAASLWALRDRIALIFEYFTWAAVKYSLVFSPLPALGLAICIGMTVGVLLWQSRNILQGLPEQERKQLERQVCRICQQGRSHPLWKFICKSGNISA